MDLLFEKCVPCNEGAELLSSSEKKSLLAQLNGWFHHSSPPHEFIAKDFLVKNYQQGLDFAANLGKLAERVNHHPKIILQWGKVTVWWWTYAINGLHKNDFIMAAQTDREWRVIQNKKKIDYDSMTLVSLKMPPELDSFYRKAAYRMGVTKPELMRLFLEFGQKFLKTGTGKSLDELKAALNALGPPDS